MVVSGKESDGEKDLYIFCSTLSCPQQNTGKVACGYITLSLITHTCKRVLICERVQVHGSGACLQRTLSARTAQLSRALTITASELVSAKNGRSQFHKRRSVATFGLRIGMRSLLRKRDVSFMHCI